MRNWMDLNGDGDIDGAEMMSGSGKAGLFV